MLDKVEKLPIYQKGREIGELVRKITELADSENEDLQRVCGEMLIDAYNLSVKVAGAEGADLYDIRMENAAIIRKSARELVVNTHGLDMFGFNHPEYYPLIREAVEEYRLLFTDWVDGFDEWNYVIDRWGLFNPPGVGPHDKDPDDDVPFNPNDLLG
ncbi:MAG: hypothetical protein ACPGU4_05935 [Flavobacteriales bacterium]